MQRLARILYVFCGSNTLMLVLAVVMITLIPSPTAAQQTGTGSICVLAFLDNNGNGARDPGDNPDPLLTNVNVNLIVNEKVVIANHVTDGKEPFCFPDLPPQQYTVSFSSPLNKATTSTSFTFTLAAGERATREYGAAPVPTAATPEAAQPAGIAIPVTQRTRIGLSAIVAVLAMGLIGGIGMILYGLFGMRKK